MFVLMISIIIALVIVIFAVQNAALVPVQFLMWSTELPLVLVIFCSVFAGALLIFCLAVWRDLKYKIKKHSNNQVLKITRTKSTDNNQTNTATTTINKENTFEDNGSEKKPKS